MGEWDWGTNERHMHLEVTVVDSRISNIYPCLIFDTTIKGIISQNFVTIEVCKVVIIDGILWCVEEDMVGGDEILTLFPVKDDNRLHNLAIQYTFCATKMEKYCNAPAALPSLEPNEAIVSLHGFTISNPITG